MAIGGESRKDTFRIFSDRLEVELAWPGSPIQQGARFDLSGHVVQVTLDGSHRFCAPEGYDEKRGSGGLGLCNEFVDVPRAMYGATQPGERFPKLGVGLLTRESDGEYNFMNHYQKEPYPIEVAVEGAAALFTVQPVECRGYAVRLQKRVSVRDNWLHIDYRLENVGSQPLDMMEYNHNFVRIDDYPVGPGYQLTYSYDVALDKVPDILMLRGGEFTWKSVPGEPFFCLPKGFEGVGPHEWRLVHEPSGVGMREVDDFPVGHMALWGLSHVVSPEVFIKAVVRPGESLEWSRKYEFFT